jgi:hypothetical protein
MGLYQVDAMESLIRTTLEIPSQAHMSSATILQVINDGYKDVTSRAFCIENEDTVRMVTGNRIVPFTGHRVNYVESVYTTGIGSSAALAELTGPVLPQGTRSIAFGNGMWVVGGTKVGVATIYYSTDLSTWTEATIDSLPSGSAETDAILFDGTSFTAVGYPYNQGFHGMILTSPDGINWTRRQPSLTLRMLQSLAYGNGVLVGGGVENSGLKIYVATSTDHGATWVDRTYTPSVSYATWLRGMAYGSGRFVAVGGNMIQNTRHISYSTDDGATWAEASSYSSGSALRAVAWTGTVFFAVGVDGKCMTSPTGDIWTEKTTPKAVTLNTITVCGTDVICAGNNDGTDTYVIKTSDSGASFVELSAPHAYTLLGSTFANNQTVLTGTQDNHGTVYMLSSTYTPGTDYPAYGPLMKVQPENLGHIMAESSVPQYWFQWMDKVVVEPVPDAPYTLKLYTSDYPTTQLTLTTESPTSLPPEFQPCIVDFACYVLSLRLKKWSKASKYYNLYISNLKKRTQSYMDRKAEKRSLHTVPDTVTYSGGQPWAH